MESGLQYLLGEQARRASRGLKEFKSLLLDANLSPPKRKSGDVRNFFSAQISVACSLRAHLEALGF